MAARNLKLDQAIKKSRDVVIKEVANLEKIVKIAQDESNLNSKLKTIQIGILSKSGVPKVVAEMKKFFDNLAIFSEEELTQSSLYVKNLLFCLKTFSTLLLPLQKEVTDKPCMSTFYADICPPLYTVARGLYEMMYSVLDKLIKSSGPHSETEDVPPEFTNTLRQLFQCTRSMVTGLDFSDVDKKFCGSCHKQCLELVVCLCSLCEKALSVLGQTKNTRCGKHILLNLFTELFSVIGYLCDTVLLPLVQFVNQLSKYPALFKAIQALLITVTITVKQFVLDGSEFKPGDRRLMLDRILILIDDNKCCLPTIHKFGDDCLIQVKCFRSMCFQLADWFRNVKKIEPDLCLESEIKVTVPWSSSAGLASCYLKRADDIDGALKEEILDQIKLQPEQNIVSDIFVVDKLSNKFRMQKKGKKALISFPGNVEDDPEKLVFVVHVQVNGKWKQVKTNYQDGTLSFEEHELDIFVAISDFPVEIHTVTPEEGCRFESSLQPGLTAEIPPGATDEAEDYQFKVSPINRERLEEYKEAANESQPTDKSSDTEELVADEETQAKTNMPSSERENASLVSLSDGLIVQRTSDKPLNKSAKVTFPLEGQKDSTEVFLVRIRSDDDIEVYYEDELSIVNNINNFCTVELKGFSINHMGRVKKLIKRKSKEDIRADTLLVLGKISVCKIHISYTTTKNSVVFRCECIDTKKKKLRRKKSKENLKTTLTEKWDTVPIYSPSHDIMLKEKDTIQIVVGGFFFAMQESCHETMSITFLRNAESYRTFPVKFKRPKFNDDQSGTLTFVEDGKPLHTVYFEQNLLPPPPKAPRQQRRTRILSGRMREPGEETTDGCIDEAVLTSEEKNVQRTVNKLFEAGGSVISDKSLTVLASFMSIADTKKLLLQLGVSWKDVDMVLDRYSGRYLSACKQELLIKWRTRQAKRTDLPELLIQGLRDIYLHRYANIVEEVYYLGGGLQPANLETEADEPESPTKTESVYSVE